MARPRIDKYFMDIAFLVAKRSTCIRRSVGAVLVRDKMIVSTGYNGAPRESSHCDINNCMRNQYNVPSGQQHELCRGVHAEQNTIIQAAYHGMPTRDSTIYCTVRPCIICAKMLKNAGIVKVVYSQSYPDKLVGSKEIDINLDLVEYR